MTPSEPMVPLAALFGKAEATAVKVSPGGKYVAWLARGDGVLDLWLAPCPPPPPSPSPSPLSPPASESESESRVQTRSTQSSATSSSSSSASASASANASRTKWCPQKDIPGARQLTAVTDRRDVCFSYHFTQDDKRILYLRETKQGSEFYHLYCLDLAAPGPVASGRDMLENHPNLTCAVGFVGSLQLWLPPAQPHLAILSTGTGSLLWNLSSLDLETGELKDLVVNPANSKIGLLMLVLRGLLYLLALVTCTLVRVSTLSLISPCIPATCRAPAAPLQYFVGKDGEIIGCAECSLSVGGIAMSFARYLAPGKWKSVGLEIPLADLNMQLVGSGAATGTLRMDRLSDDAADLSVAIHTCDVADTTAYIALPSGQVLANHPVADIEDFVINPCTGLVEAVLVVVDHTELIPISDSGKRYEQALSRLAVRLGREGAGDTILACSRSALDDVWVLCVTSDARPAEYYVIHFPYDISATVNPFVVSRPDLALYTLGEAEAVKIPSRTGELLSGYLTRPPTSPPKEPQPLALLLHGGPSARDCPGYNPIVQLLASRGISVLSVNYRGSTGYGMKFLKKGNGDVKGMHDDVEDARRWAVDNGIARSNQIAILGGSWGGYLALGGAAYLSPASSLHGVETPTSCISNHRYAAVVAIVPPVTVGKANTSTAFRGDPLVARYWRQIYGDDVSDNLVAAELLSPLFHLQQLRGTKLLLIHGEDDPRVPREHGDIVAAAALELHVPGAYVTYAMEGHSIRREPNVLHMWHTTEKFLCQSLGLPSPPELVADAVQNHTATVHWNSSQEIH